MQKKLKIDGEFKIALPVLEKIWAAGYEAYYVGGSVRDRLLGLEVNDVDIATSAMPEEIKAIFPRTVDLGIEHGTVLVLVEDRDYEITTFRTESTYKDFRRPDSVTFVRSLKEDLKRRDFTMNAIAMDIDGQLNDPYGGLDDIEAEIIQAVGDPHERFNEDALRMMRAVRFAAQLAFTIEGETLLSIKENAQLLTKIAVERIQIEFEKLLTGHWRQIGLKAMLDTDLYLYCPALGTEIKALEALIDDPLAFTSPDLAWAMLIYQINHFKPEGHFKDRQFLVRWKLSNKMIQQIRALYFALKERVEKDRLDAFTIFTLGKTNALKVEDLMMHLGHEGQHQKVEKIYQQLVIKKRSELAVTGHDLMQASPTKAGPWLGDALDFALESVIYQKVANDKNSIIHYLKENKQFPIASSD